MKMKMVLASAATLAMASSAMAANNIDHRSYHHTGPMATMAQNGDMKTADVKKDAGMKKDMSKDMAAKPAAEAPAARSDWTFFLGGVVGGGFADSRFSTTSDVTINAVAQPTANLGGRDQTPYGLVGVCFGFMYQMTEMFYTGLEVEGNFDDIKLGVQYADPAIVNPYIFDLSRKYQVIASLIFGYNCTETSAVYVKLGVGFTDYVYCETSDPAAVFKNRTNVISFVPAIGVSTDICDCVAARLELSGEFFGKNPCNIIDIDVLAPPLTVDATSHAHFNNFAAKVSFVWKI